MGWHIIDHLKRKYQLKYCGTKDQKIDLKSKLAGLQI